MTVKLKETRKWRLLWRIATQPEIFPCLFDDRFLKSSNPNYWIRVRVRSLIANRSNHVFSVWYENRLAGCFVLCKTANEIYEVHTLLMKEFHGKIGLEIGRFATRFGLDLPYVKKLTSYCPENLPHTFLFARLCGFKHVGEYPLEWIVKGVQYAMKAVEIEKEDLCPC